MFEIELFLHLTMFKQKKLYLDQWLTVCKLKIVLMLNWIVLDKEKPFNCVPRKTKTKNNNNNIKQAQSYLKNVVFKTFLEIIYLIYL